MLPVVLVDKLGYQMLEVSIPVPLPNVIIWGDSAYYKVNKTKYKETTLHVLPDTFTKELRLP